MQRTLCAKRARRSLVAKHLPSFLEDARQQCELTSLLAAVILRKHAVVQRGSYGDAVPDAAELPRPQQEYLQLDIANWDRVTAAAVIGIA